MVRTYWRMNIYILMSTDVRAKFVLSIDGKIPPPTIIPSDKFD